MKTLQAERPGQSVRSAEGKLNPAPFRIFLYILFLLKTLTELSTCRPWTVWDVSRTKKNSKKNCSNLHTILVTIELPLLVLTLALQKKWYTSCYLIVRRENRPMKMRQRSWCGPDAAPLTRPVRGWTSANWMVSLTISSARGPPSRPGEISTGQPAT